MKTNKGFAPIIAIIIAVVIIAGGVGGYLYIKNKNNLSIVTPSNTLTTTVVTTTSTVVTTTSSLDAVKLAIEEKAIKKVVEAFYNNQISSSGNKQSYEESSYLTDGLKEKINQIIASFGDGPGFNPILCAQDIPTYIGPEKVTITNNKANVIVFDSFTDHQIKLMVEKINEEWKITDISCK